MEIGSNIEIAGVFRDAQPSKNQRRSTTIHRIFLNQIFQVFRALWRWALGARGLHLGDT